VPLLKMLKKNESELFSGRVWIGVQALDLGLVDALGSLDTIARKINTGIVDYTPQPDWLLQLRKVAGLKMSMNMMQSGLSQGLIEPLLGLVQPIRGLTTPAIGLL
jgi:ClpP class serine protease